MEQGTHDELIALNGHYAKLVAAASNEEATDDAGAAAGVEAEQTPAVRVPDAATVEPEQPQQQQQQQQQDEAALSRRGSLGKSTRRWPSLLEAMTTVQDIEARDVEGGPAKPVPASTLLWKLALEEWDMLYLGLLGSMVNGAGFPLLGYLISRSQTLFYYTDPNKIERKRDRARQVSV